MTTLRAGAISQKPRFRRAFELKVQQHSRKERGILSAALRSVSRTPALPGFAEPLRLAVGRLEAGRALPLVHDIQILSVMAVAPKFQAPILLGRMRGMRLAQVARRKF